MNHVEYNLTEENHEINLYDGTNLNEK